MMNLVLATLLSPINCPSWIGPGPTVAPPGVELSNDQKRLNKLRCYWTIVIREERRCKSRYSPPKCDARTSRWLESNFMMASSLTAACSDLRRHQDEIARTLMINTWEGN